MFIHYNGQCNKVQHYFVFHSESIFGNLVVCKSVEL